MAHLVLLGDSIFDNGVYVPGLPDVVQQLRSELGSDDQATLLAVDGDVTADVERQLSRMPAGATHLFISVGGNDALRASSLLHERVNSVAEGVDRLRRVVSQFAADYAEMLSVVASQNKLTTVCTVYDSIPGLEPAAVTALGAFNEAILRCAFQRGLPVIDLRLICNQASDYSPRSPIEPSHLGGEKIARAIATVFREHDFRSSRTTVYI